MKAFGSRMRYHREENKKEREERVNQKNVWYKKEKENLIYSAHMKP